MEIRRQVEAVSLKPATLSSGDDVSIFTYHFYASENVIAGVKSLLMKRRSVKFRDTQTLISGFNMSRHFLCCWSLNFWQQGKTSLSSNVKLFPVSKLDLSCHCMNNSFKTHFMSVSVLYLGLIFTEEIKHCLFKIQNFSVASCVKF